MLNLAKRFLRPENRESMIIYNNLVMNWKICCGFITPGCDFRFRHCPSCSTVYYQHIVLLTNSNLCHRLKCWATWSDHWTKANCIIFFPLLNPQNAAFAFVCAKSSAELTGLSGFSVAHWTIDLLFFCGTNYTAFKWIPSIASQRPLSKELPICTLAAMQPRCHATWLSL